MAAPPHASRLGSALRQVGRLPAWVDLLAIALLGAMFTLLSLDTMINHDEDQYLGGAVLALDRMIFRDFMHLQTPLQAWLFAPVAALFPGHALAALRVANALAALVALVGVYAAQRCAGIRGRAALVATVLLALCPAFRISASVVRNDMVPLAFSSFGLAAALLALRRAPPAALLWFTSGLLFGLATSAKVSHAFLLAGAGLFLLWRSVAATPRSPQLRPLLAYGGGGLAGLLPIVIVVAAAPDAVRFGVLDYFGPGVFDWYRRNGLGDMLTVRSNLTRMFGYLAGGPGLPALAILLAVAAATRRRTFAPRPELGLLAILLAAGGAAALLPTPAWSYYLLTFLLPLFILFGIAIDHGIARRPALTLLAVAAVMLSALPPARDYAKRTRNTLAEPPAAWTIPQFERQAHWVGRVLREAGARGPLATLSPFAMLDSGYPLDPRFATGVFVFRSGHLVAPADHARFHTVGPQTLARALDAQPPAAILTGYEDGSPLFSIRPDDPLTRYARSRGYRLHPSPTGKARLYIAPRAPLHSRSS